MHRFPRCPSFRVLLVALSLLYLMVYLPLLDRVPTLAFDEPWYASTAHNFAGGRGLSNTVVGERGGDQFFLHTLIVAGAFKLFGTTLWIGRLVSVLIGLLAVFGWGFLCRSLAIRGWPFAVTGLLFILSNVYVVIFRRLRPEALVVALSVWALYLFVEAWQSRRSGAALACALVSGSAAMAHPNGVLLTVLLGMLLLGRTLYDRCGLTLVAGYAAGGFASVVLFVIGWTLWREQSLVAFFYDAVVNSHRLSVGSNSTTVLSTISTNLTTFLPAYSLGLRRLYILIFELGVLLVGLMRYRRDNLAAILGLLGILWFVAAVSLLTPFYRWSFAIVIIFSLTVTGRLLSDARTTLTRRGAVALCLCVSVYALNNAAGDAYLMRLHATNTPYGRVTEVLDAKVPDGVPVLTDLELWFPFQNNVAYTPITRWWATRYADLDALLTSGDLRYVVTSAAFSEGSSPLSPLTRERDYALYDNTDYYDRLHRHIETYVRHHCDRIDVLATHGYGAIETWRCDS